MPVVEDDDLRVRAAEQIAIATPMMTCLQTLKPSDTIYYQALTLPEDVETFISSLQQQMESGLGKLDKGMPRNKAVTIGGKGNKGLIRLSPFDALPDPINLRQLKGEINRLWHKTSLLDILKETDLRVDFTRKFKSMGTREILDRETLQKRLPTAIRRCFACDSLL